MEAGDIDIYNWRGRELGEEPIYCAAPSKPDDVICYGSDDEGDPKARIDKRLRYEEQGQRYLQGQTPFLLSAALYGPFDKASGWQNPWMQNSQSKRQTHTDSTQQDVQNIELVVRANIPNQLQVVQGKDNATPTTGDSIRCHLPSPDSIRDLCLDSANHLDHEKRSRIQEWASKITQQDVQRPDGWIFERASGLSDSGSKKRPAETEWLRSRLSKRRRSHNSQLAALSSLTPTPCTQPKDIFWDQLKSAARARPDSSDMASKSVSSSMRTTISCASGTQGHSNDLKKPFSRVTKLVDASRSKSKCISANANQPEDESQLLRSPMPTYSIHIDKRSNLRSSYQPPQDSSERAQPIKEIQRSSRVNDFRQEKAEMSTQQGVDENAAREKEIVEMSFESHLDDSFYYKSRPGREDPPMAENLAVVPALVCSQITQTGTPESGRYSDAVVIDAALLTKPVPSPNVENVTPSDSAMSSPSPVDDLAPSAKDTEWIQKEARNNQSPLETDPCTGHFIAERTSLAEAAKQLISAGVEKDNEEQISPGPAADTGNSSLSTPTMPNDGVSSPSGVQRRVLSGQDEAPSTTPSPFITELGDLRPFIIPELALVSPLKLLASPAMLRSIELREAFDVPTAVQTESCTKPSVIDEATDSEHSCSSERALERTTTCPPTSIPKRSLSDQSLVTERLVEQLAAEAELRTVGDPMILDNPHSTDVLKVPQESNIVGFALSNNNRTAALTKVPEISNSLEKEAPTRMSAMNEDEVAYDKVVTTDNHGMEDPGETALIPTNDKAIEVSSSPAQPLRHIGDRFEPSVIKIEPVDSNEHTAGALQESVLLDNVHDIQQDTPDIKVEPGKDRTSGPCAGHISIPSSPVVQPSSSGVRASQQSPWMKTMIAPAVPISQTLSELTVDSTTSNTSGKVHISDEVQSPWIDDSLHGSWHPLCLTATPSKQGPPHIASQTEGMQVSDVDQDSLVHHPFTPVVSRRASTPELGFSIKSFANFNTPSPKRRSSGMIYPRFSSSSLPSALKYRRNALPRPSLPSSARRVTFAPLPDAGAEVETARLRHPSALRPASPPPLALTSIEPGDEDEDGHFQKHFEVMRRRSGDAPKFRLAPRLLPDSSQQVSASPDIGAMAEAFRDADAQEDLSEDLMITDGPHASSLGGQAPTTQKVQSIAGTPQFSVQGTGEDHNTPQNSWQSGDQIDVGDDVADVLRNLDDFLNPRWDIDNEMEKAARPDTGKENQGTRLEGAEADLWGTSIWDIPQDPEEGMETLMTWN